MAGERGDICVLGVKNGLFQLLALNFSSAHRDFAHCIFRDVPGLYHPILQGISWVKYAYLREIMQINLAVPRQVADVAYTPAGMSV